MCTKSELQKVLEKIQLQSKIIYGELLSKIILYGSYARRDNTDESDIDIMILLNCNDEIIEKYKDVTVEMSSDISIDSDVFVSIVLRNVNIFNERKEFLPFYQNIASEGIAIYG